MKTIKLYGSLAEQFGEEFRLDVHSPAEAFRALSCQLKGFCEAVTQGSFELIRGVDIATQVHFTQETLHFPIGQNNTLHIIPAVFGAGGNGGVGKIILGAVIMVAAVVAAPYTGGTSLAAGMSAFSFGAYGAAAFMFGLSMMLTGVATMLQPNVKPNFDMAERPDARASFFLGGQINRVEQGGPVTLIYGRTRVGSTVISAGLSTEQM